MLFLEFLRFGSMFVVWKAIMLLVTYYMIKRNPDSATASALATVAI